MGLLSVQNVALGALAAVVGGLVVVAVMPSETAASSASTQLVNLDSARRVLKEPTANVVILGDSTGNEVGEWPDLWSSDLASNRPISLHLYDPKESKYTSPVHKGGDDPDTSLWVGAIPGATGATLSEQWQHVWPGGTADLVLLSLGQNGSATKFAEQTSPLLEKVRTGAPDAAVVVILQAPRAKDANAPSREAVRQWAALNRLPTIDVAAAFNRSKTPLGNFLTNDGIHPNAAGQRLWTFVVEKALA